MENVEPFDKCGNESYEDENGVYHSYYGLDTDNESDYNELVYAICESKNCPKSEVVRLVKEQYDYFGITHFDVCVWKNGQVQKKKPYPNRFISTTDINQAQQDILWNTMTWK